MSFSKVPEVSPTPFPETFDDASSPIRQKAGENGEAPRPPNPLDWSKAMPARLVMPRGGETIISNDVNEVSFVEAQEGVKASVADDGRDPREPEIFDVLRQSKSKPISPAVRALAEEITAGCTNEVGRARAIYDWITSNIVYDSVEWENLVHGAKDYTHEHDPESVLERGTTVCIGYAWLFDDLCEAAGVAATWLIGDVRGYRGTPDEELTSKFRHAWNAVKLDDGEWHLLDATWGATQGADLARTDYYFDTPAEQFVFDHMPESNDWQLLPEPLPPDRAFKSLPNLKPSFFTDGLKLGGKYGNTRGAKANATSQMALQAPPGVYVAAAIGNGDGNFTQVRTVSNGKGVFRVLVPGMASGQYILQIYSGRNPERLSCSADFAIRFE